MSKLRVLIAEEIEHARENLSAFLELQEDVEVVARAGSVSETAALARRLDPDVVILSAAMPGLTQCDVIKPLLDQQDSTALILMTVSGSTNLLPAGVQAGVYECLEKSAGVDQLIDALSVIKEELSRRSSE